MFWILFHLQDFSIREFGKWFLKSLLLWHLTPYRMFSNKCAGGLQNTSCITTWKKTVLYIWVCFKVVIFRCIVNVAKYLIVKWIWCILYYIYIFSCPQQLNRWPCPLPGRSLCLLPLTIRFFTTLQSDPRYLWPDF